MKHKYTIELVKFIVPSKNKQEAIDYLASFLSKEEIKKSIRQVKEYKKFI